MRRFLILILVIIAIAGLMVWSPEGSDSSRPSLNEYVDPSYGFSLVIPEGFKLNSFRNPDGGMTFVVVNDQNRGVQLVVKPFDENIVLTETRIKKDLPELKMEGAGEVEVDSISAVKFTSDYDQFGGESLNVWFTYGGHLYQFASRPDEGAVMQDIISTMKLRQ